MTWKHLTTQSLRTLWEVKYKFQKLLTLMERQYLKILANQTRWDLFNLDQRKETGCISAGKLADSMK